MRCKNSGSDYNADDVQWTCTASLPPEFKLGSTDVMCEGYESSEDPYVLKGSCGVEYRLMLTEQGEEKYGRHKGSDWFNHGSGSSNTGTSLFGYVFAVVFVGVLAWMLYSIYKQRAGNAPQPPGREPRFGGGAGWGGDENDDPPPPYSPQPRPKKSQGTNPTNAQGQWRPGVWTGALGGAAAGYLANNYANRQQQRPAPTRPNYDYGSNGRPSSNGEGSGSFSSQRYESTGFGSSSRR